MKLNSYNYFLLISLKTIYLLSILLGIDMTHNPEFTSVESYAAYNDLYDLINMVEELLSFVVKNIHGSFQCKYDGQILDFTPPYQRIEFITEIEKSSNTKIPTPYDSDISIQVMKSIITEQGEKIPQPETASKLLDKLCDIFIERKITTKPCFIVEHPQIMSPLAKWY